LQFFHKSRGRAWSDVHITEILKVFEISLLAGDTNAKNPV